MKIELQEEKLYKEKYQPFYNNLNNYFETFIIPEALAFYLASSYHYHLLNKYPLENYLNSALNLFNVNCDINKIISIIEKILIIKYHLRITETKPLIIKKV